jgi:ABC-type lipoprotein export system ATPase subunit
MPLVELINVSKSYREGNGAREVPVLREISLTVEPGESVAIVGPSGCGKSTLLNVLGTLDAADTGEVRFEGKSINGASVAELSALRSEKLGFIFQLHHLMPQCTVLENVLLPTLALAKKGDAAAAEARGRELLIKVGLEAQIDRLPAQLSGGERQRVAVVRALINQPRLILADEPTGALDVVNAAALTDLLLDLQRSRSLHALAYKPSEMLLHYRSE